MKTKSRFPVDLDDNLSAPPPFPSKTLKWLAPTAVAFLCASIWACHLSSSHSNAHRFTFFDLVLLALWAYFAVAAYLVFRKHTAKYVPPPETVVVVDWSLVVILGGSAVLFMGALIGAALAFYPKIAVNVIVPSIIAICGLVTAAAIFTAFRQGQEGSKKKAINRLCLFLVLLVCLTAGGLFWELDSRQAPSPTPNEEHDRMPGADSTLPHQDSVGASNT